MNSRQDGIQEDRPGFVAGLAGIARNTFALFVNRVELVALELGEIRNNLGRLLLAGALGILALWFAIACWTALVVVLAWDAMGWKILPLIAGLFSALAIGILLRVRRMLNSEGLSMSATMNELRNDRDALL